jgi:hypothetical protein
LIPYAIDLDAKMVKLAESSRAIARTARDHPSARIRVLVRWAIIHRETGVIPWCRQSKPRDDFTE